MERILERLMTGETISGETMARELGVTRAAVFKHIEQLRALGFGVESAARQGYRLTACPDSLLAPVVRQGLDTRWAGCRIEYLQTVDSTNRYARALAQQGAPHGTLVLADEQTAGRGRRGRGWISPAGEGVFMSLILRPQAHPSQVARLSLLTALAVAEGIAGETGLDARIKWPNDIVVGGSKVCGMLLEMNADEQSVHDVVAGVGINVHNAAFPEGVQQIATSIFQQTGQHISRAALIASVMEQFEVYYEKYLETEDLSALQEEYNQNLVNCNQAVRVLDIREGYTGTARGINARGELLVLTGDGIRKVSAGEVSVRGVYGYV